MSLPKNIHAGRYEIKKGMGNFEIVKMLKQGHQSPVKLVINKLRTKEDIINKLSSQLEPDTDKWKSLFIDTQFLQENKIDSNQIQVLILPNTYQVYWNTPPKKVFEKLTAYTNKFWNETRIAKAKQLNLTPVQVSIIASIVEEETNKNDEKPNIASVYINRYKKGMKLEADPTVKFAIGNFSLKRILNVHLKYESPYNTYFKIGLPPGPICTPSEKSIDAVLNAAETNYLFFCAKEDFSGYHNFASTYSEHLVNAKKFQNALNQRGIK
ncbi:MAG: aminodeoxychorismate lyase [Bacteroidetes bacterium OLB11]|nr:MAG: aminodeoxychorismate lyase [Bacteroidetes bacterium OLB11]